MTFRSQCSGGAMAMENIQNGSQIKNFAKEFTERNPQQLIMLCTWLCLYLQKFAAVPSASSAKQFR